MHNATADKWTLVAKRLLTTIGKSEGVVYTAVWAMVFLGPAMNLYVRMLNIDEGYFPFSELLHSWLYSSTFFVVFMVHDRFLAPLLIYKNRPQKYLGWVLTLLTLFLILHFAARPLLYDQHALERYTLPSFIADQMVVVNAVLAVLMMGMNLSIKLYYKTRAESNAQQEREKQILTQQRDYLRYQVNPHFLMNTLNNIHALVDINPALAKSTIRELSSLMRYILYEASSPTVSLQHEIVFMRKYTNLMRMRYAGHVKITSMVPDKVPDKQIPPLVFIIFVENAFKHGISYKEPSFINIDLALKQDRVVFTCRNSNHPRQASEKGGVGLRNVRRRLELIYGDSFKLDICNDVEQFSIRLEMPFTDMTEKK